LPFSFLLLPFAKMIPLQLTLKNFLSYRETTLDFRGLHTACICGANGAGKSSLLEAITWTIWGQSRAESEDDTIYAGEQDMRVDFEFVSNRETYRIIRSRQKGKSSSLEFQIKNDLGNYRSLTEKGLRNTQEKINSSLKLDYDTFINSAYLRQGRADEFMLRRPSERKQILADLLKLNQYEKLAEQAKDLSKQLKGKVEELEQSLQPLAGNLQQREAIDREKIEIEKELKQLQKSQENDREELEKLQAVEHQRQTYQQQLTWQQGQYQNLTQECDRVRSEIDRVQNQLTKLATLLDREPEISAGYQQFLSLQQEQETLAAKFQAYQDAQQQLQSIQQQLIKETNALNLQIQQTQTRLETLEQQEAEIAQILSVAPEVQKGLAQLQRHRQNLNELDRIQFQVTPLLKQRQNIQTEKEKVEAKLTARLEQLRAQEEEFSLDMAKMPQMRQELLSIDAQLGELDKKRVYQQRVQDKESEQTRLRERLQENQRACEKELVQLRQKLDLLQTPDSVCPLCEQHLDEDRRYQVITKTQTQQEQIDRNIWAIREQITGCEQKLQKLRQEFTQLSDELTAHDSLQHQLGQKEAQLEATMDLQRQLQQIKSEIESIERSLVIGNYAEELASELKELYRQIAELNYDDRTHALARQEVEKWRWAEIKQAKIEDANRRQEAIEAQKPDLIAKIANLQAQLASLSQDSPLKQKSEELEQYINELSYDRSHHNAVIASLRQTQSWQLQQRDLDRAKEEYPQLRSRLQQLEQTLQLRLNDTRTIQEQFDRIKTQMKQIEDNRREIAIIEAQIQQKRQRLDELIAEKGRLQQLSNQIEDWQIQYEHNSQRLAQMQKQYRVYQELAQAFGKNGIQALMIENVLPQLEAETNNILARLTGNQFHVQFLTQRSGRGSSSKKSSKLIDTLEILIADTRGTRSYETYSGGEAFRINFSIRLALARLLAQRAGTSLQMLIVDEGFGTQDTEGCDRLVAAINAIASDFACILTVTHMPQFKEAFQTRIEVRKTERGSQLSLT
jgi:exonuclease SbcC